jgi:DNA-binding XRE family transcriptional regulator
MLAHMKTRHIEKAVEIVLTVPVKEAMRVSETVRVVMELAGHKVRHVNGDGEELYSIAEVFPEAHPGMVLRGFRGRDDMTQKALAEQLGISQNRVSDMESGKRPISRRMAEKLGVFFKVPYKAFLAL